MNDYGLNALLSCYVEEKDIQEAMKVMIGDFWMFYMPKFFRKKMESRIRKILESTALRVLDDMP